MISLEKHRYSACLILVIILIPLSYFYKDINQINSLEVPYYPYVEFSSDSKDNSIKKLNYTIPLKNNSNKNVNFHIVIERPKNDWYPYMDSIPSKFYSEMIYMNPKEGRILEIKYNYKSKDNRLTGGWLNNLKVSFISDKEYKKLA